MRGRHFTASMALHVLAGRGETAATPSSGTSPAAPATGSPATAMIEDATGDSPTGRAKAKTVSSASGETIQFTSLFEDKLG
jgi:hypothetical protein